MQLLSSFPVLFLALLSATGTLGAPAAAKPTRALDARDPAPARASLQARVVNPDPSRATPDLLKRVADPSPAHATPALHERDANPSPFQETKAIHAPRACKTVTASVIVPIDSTRPTLSYGAGQTVTLWRHPDGSQRRTLMKFDLPPDASPTTCRFKFLAQAAPPMALSGPSYVSLNKLKGDVMPNNTWDSRPLAMYTVGGGHINISKTVPTSVEMLSGPCGAGSMSYELVMNNVGGSLGFETVPGNGFFIEYGC